MSVLEPGLVFLGNHRYLAWKTHGLGLCPGLLRSPGSLWYLPSQCVCVCVCVCVCECVSTAVVWGGPGQRIVTTVDSDFGLLVFSHLSSGIFMPAVRYQTRLLPTYSLAT